MGSIRAYYITVQYYSSRSSNLSVFLWRTKVSNGYPEVLIFFNLRRRCSSTLRRFYFRLWFSRWIIRVTNLWVNYVCPTFTPSLSDCSIQYLYWPHAIQSNFSWFLLFCWGLVWCVSVLPSRLPGNLITLQALQFATSWIVEIVQSQSSFYFQTRTFRHRDTACVTPMRDPKRFPRHFRKTKYDVRGSW